MHDLFDEDEDGPAYEALPGEDRRCTEGTLLAFIRQMKAATGKMPTLRDCKGRFGGILGPLIVGGRLREKGLI